MQESLQKDALLSDGSTAMEDGWMPFTGPFNMSICHDPLSWSWKAEMQRSDQEMEEQLSRYIWEAQRNFWRETGRVGRHINAPFIAAALDTSKETAWWKYFTIKFSIKFVITALLFAQRIGRVIACWRIVRSIAPHKALRRKIATMPVVESVIARLRQQSADSHIDFRIFKFTNYCADFCVCGGYCVLYFRD